MRSQGLARRSAFVGILALLAVAGCNGCKTDKPNPDPSDAAAAGQTATAGPVKIGLVMTLSGPQGKIGKELEQGFMLALSNAGMQAGGRKLQVISNDDKNDPAEGAALAKQLIETEKVDLLVGPSHSNVVMSIRDVVHERKKLLLNPNAGAAPLAASKCSEYIFNTGRMNPLYAESMGRYLAKKGIKSVAVMAADYQAGADIVKGFRDAFVNEGNGKVVAEILTPMTTTDFGPHLKRIADAKPDAAFAFYTGELAVTFIKDYDKAGLKTKLPLYVTGYTVEQDVLPLQGDAALGVQSISVYGPFLDNPANKSFAPVYRTKYGAYPSEYSVLAYDAGQVLVSAINATKGKTDNEALLPAVMAAKVDSPRGPFKFGPNHTAIQDAYLREVVKQDGQLVNKVIATAWPSYYYPGEGEPCGLPGVKR